MGKLDGQVAIVTGAGSGIGRATALMLAAEGAAVVVAGRRGRRSTPSSPRSPGPAAAPTPARSTSATRTRPRALARWTVERHGRVDVLVNNAGSSSRVRNVRWVGQEEWERVFAVNMTGVYALTQAVLPDMIARGGGTIVTVSSAAALRPGLLGGAPYGAAKAAVRNLMGHIHTVLRDKGIRATTILPAEVDTPILENRPLVPDARARATMMQPEDVAAAILLCVTLPPRTVVEEIVLSPTIHARPERRPGGGARLGGPRPRPRAARAAAAGARRRDSAPPSAVRARAPAPAAGPAPGRGRLGSWGHRNARWLFPAPAVLLVAAIIVYPVVYTVWMSLQDWFASSLTPPKFVGLANYRKILFGDPRFQVAVVRTLYFTGAGHRRRDGARRVDGAPLQPGVLGARAPPARSRSCPWSRRRSPSGSCS